MTLTHAAFLSAIAECPDDDAPRLIYADWLDDEGLPDRAELIRAQCRLARLPGDSPEHRLLTRRCSDLLTAHERGWRAALPELDGITWEGFDRGFVEAAFAVTAEAFLTHAEALFAAAPVRRVQIGRLGDDGARALARSPHLARLTELNLGNNPELHREGTRALAHSPHAANLTSLLLHYCHLGDEAIRPLTRSPHLGQLTELYLSGNDLSDDTGVWLGEAEAMPALALLDLRDNQIGDAGVEGLAFSPYRAALVELWLVNNRAAAAAAEALAWTTGLPQLARLYLNYNPVGNDGAVALAEAPGRGALAELDLRHAHVRDAGGRALAASPSLGGLQALWLGGNRLRVETLTLLRRRYGERLRL